MEPKKWRLRSHAANVAARANFQTYRRAYGRLSRSAGTDNGSVEELPRVEATLGAEVLRQGRAKEMQKENDAFEEKCARMDRAVERRRQLALRAFILGRNPKSLMGEAAPEVMSARNSIASDASESTRRIRRSQRKSRRTSSVSNAPLRGRRRRASVESVAGNYEIEAEDDTQEGDDSGSDREEMVMAALMTAVEVENAKLGIGPKTMRLETDPRVERIRDEVKARTQVLHDHSEIPADLLKEVEEIEIVVSKWHKDKRKTTGKAKYGPEDAERLLFRAGMGVLSFAQVSGPVLRATAEAAMRRSRQTAWRNGVTVSSLPAAVAAARMEQAADAEVEARERARRMAAERVEDAWQRENAPKRTIVESGDKGVHTVDDTSKKDQVSEEEEKQAGDLFTQIAKSVPTTLPKTASEAREQRLASERTADSLAASLLSSKVLGLGERKTESVAALQSAEERAPRPVGRVRTSFAAIKEAYIYPYNVMQHPPPSAPRTSGTLGAWSSSSWRLDKSSSPTSSPRAPPVARPLPNTHPGIYDAIYTQPETSTQSTTPPTTPSKKIPPLRRSLSQQMLEQAAQEERKRADLLEQQADDELEDPHHQKKSTVASNLATERRAANALATPATSHDVGFGATHIGAVRITLQRLRAARREILASNGPPPPLGRVRFRELMSDILQAIPLTRIFAGASGSQAYFAREAKQESRDIQSREATSGIALMKRDIASRASATRPGSTSSSPSSSPSHKIKHHKGQAGVGHMLFSEHALSRGERQSKRVADTLKGEKFATFLSTVSEAVYWLILHSLFFSPTKKSESETETETPQNTAERTTKIIEQWRGIEEELGFDRSSRTNLHAVVLVCLKACLDAVFRGAFPAWVAFERTITRYHVRFDKGAPPNERRGKTPWQIKDSTGALEELATLPRDFDIATIFSLPRVAPLHAQIDAFLAALLDPNRFSSEVPSLSAEMTAFARRNRSRHIPAKASGALERALNSSNTTSRVSFAPGDVVSATGDHPFLLRPHKMLHTTSALVRVAAGIPLAYQSRAMLAQAPAAASETAERLGIGGSAGLLTSNAATSKPNVLGSRLPMERRQKLASSVLERAQQEYESGVRGSKGTSFERPGIISQIFHDEHERDDLYHQNQLEEAEQTLRATKKREQDRVLAARHDLDGLPPHTRCISLETANRLHQDLDAIAMLGLISQSPFQPTPENDSVWKGPAATAAAKEEMALEERRKRRALVSRLRGQSPLRASGSPSDTLGPNLRALQARARSQNPSNFSATPPNTKKVSLVGSPSKTTILS